MNPQYDLFNQALMQWFEAHQRSFPWRETNDPYYIWISEIMSHQTQIERVANKYYPRFIEAFPTLKSLAQSNWEDVFPVWDGLGYYQRGKNCLRTAQAVMQTHKGQFPKDIDALKSLPGIGQYTAAAIMAFAFNEKYPAIDTNISKIIKTLWPSQDTIETAEALVQNASSGRTWNSAMMDLAAALRRSEIIDGTLEQNFFPPEVQAKFVPERKKTTKKKPNKKKGEKLIEVGIACIWRNGKYLIQSRPEGKSFAGFWEFPGGKREPGEDFRGCVKREIQEEIGVNVSVRPHFYEEVYQFGKTKLKLRFHRCQIQSGTPKPLESQEIKWVKPEDFFNIKFLETNHKALKKLQKFKL